MFFKINDENGFRCIVNSNHIMAIKSYLYGNCTHWGIYLADGSLIKCDYENANKIVSELGKIHGSWE